MKTKLLKKLLKMSKYAIYSIVLQCAFYSFGMSMYSDAQQLRNIQTDLNVESMYVDDLFKMIESETGFKFAYLENELPEKRISIKGSNSLETILFEVSKKTQLSFKRINNTIHVQKLQNSENAVVDLSSDEGEEISGIVKDEAGSPLPGVTILEKNTGNGTITDIDGKYLLKISGESPILVFSFVGYLTKEVSLTPGQSQLNLNLDLDYQSLEEVVVVGYGNQEKSDITGSIQQVDQATFNKGAIASADQLIAGKIAGVNIVSSSGEPGGQANIRIRGGTSLNASNQPLFVIDGVPIDNTPFNPTGQVSGRNPLSFINPEDIETMTVLKDASAAAIYGSRAANGVIIITTKSGSSGQKSELIYSTWFSQSKVVNDINVLGAEDFRNVVFQQDETRAATLGNANTNWRDELLRTAYSFNHSLSMTGGTAKMGYRFSASHQQQNGVIKGSEAKRTTFSISLNNSFLDDALKVTANFKASENDDQYTPAAAITNSFGMAPTQPVYDASSIYGGYWEWDPDTYGTQGTSRNPIAELELTELDGKTFRSIGNIDFEYKLPVIEGLSAKLNLGYDVNKGERNQFQPSILVSQATGTMGDSRVARATRESKLLETYLNYNRDLEFLNSKISATAGYSYQDFYNAFPAWRAWDLSTDIYGYHNPSVANNSQATNSVLENRLISYFGRVNFSVNDRYILTASLRRDGSSRFGKSNRWAMFPSLAAAWRVIDEPFAEFLTPVFSNLKFRFGYGVNGNQEIGDYQFLSTYTPGDIRATYQFGSNFINTIRPSAVDPDLKWEETTSMNIGVDFGFLEGRLNGSVEYYKKETNDLLFNVTVPSGANLSNRVLTNIGSIENKGLEIQLNAVVINNKDFRWNVGANLATNTNEILNLDGNTDPDFEGIQTGGITGGNGNNIQILQVGERVNSFYMYKHIMDNGRPLPDGVDHNNDGNIDLADIYEDINDDGLVNSSDRRAVESPFAKMTYGITSSTEFKNFDLSFTFRGSVGNYVYNNNKADMGFLNRVTQGGWPNNMHADVMNTGFIQPQYFSDYYLEDASFLKLDNITLGYNLVSPKFNARFYLTAQNVFVLTDYSGQDPEIGTTSTTDQNALGIDNNLFPRARTILAGLRISF
ncbi:MAG: TonB-dependent receptor [Reichenbachiella sp.]|uniref:SusC/RagA family TonB-linked outer membrane protein n=1 Tax=Reichenbachiella sp. TaxID=2184521 RepID=UPI00329A5F02